MTIGASSRNVPFLKLFEIFQSSGHNIYVQWELKTAQHSESEQPAVSVNKCRPKSVDQLTSWYDEKI